MHARVDVPTLPISYHDKLVINNKIILPFPPAPTILLIPLILIDKNISQQQAAVLIGSVNAVLVYLLLKKFTSPKNALLLTIFFALGTVHFWTSVIGTVWCFAHIAAVFFFLLALIAHFHKKDFLSGLLFASAALCRYPVIFGVVFFLLALRNEKKRLFKFLLALSPVIPIQLFYNFARFGNFFETGYLEVYKTYVQGNYAYSILRAWFPDSPHFGYADIRNIPIHIFNFLALPPRIPPETSQILPSPYGMGITFTSPLLLLSLLPPFKTKLQRNLILGALSIALAVFLHYAQGWIQFGYRFTLDFLPFLLIILAAKFKLNKITFTLLVISLLVNWWGVSRDVHFGL